MGNRSFNSLRRFNMESYLHSHKKTCQKGGLHTLIIQSEMDIIFNEIHIVLGSGREAF